MYRIRDKAKISGLVLYDSKEHCPFNMILLLKSFGNL